MLEAAGACDPRPAGTTSEPLVREADSSDGDVERYQVPGEIGVIPLGGVAFGGCVDVPVPPPLLVSPAQTPEAGTLEAADLQQWFGGGAPMDGVLSGTMEVPGGAGLEEQGATVREERPLDGWRKVRVLGMMCLRSSLESYRTGIT